jgi:hypothetical protein
MMVYTCNPSTQEAEDEGQPGLPSKAVSQNTKTTTKQQQQQKTPSKLGIAHST